MLRSANLQVSEVKSKEEKILIYENGDENGGWKGICVGSWIFIFKGPQAKVYFAVFSLIELKWIHSIAIIINSPDVISSNKNVSKRNCCFQKFQMNHLEIPNSIENLGTFYILQRWVMAVSI